MIQHFETAIWSIEAALTPQSSKNEIPVKHAIGLAKLLFDWVSKSKDENDERLRKSCANIVLTKYQSINVDSMIEQIEQVYNYVLEPYRP